MNSLKGHIIDIETHRQLSVISINIAAKITLKTMTLEDTKTTQWLQKNEPVTLLFNETDVMIATGNPNNIGLQNKFHGTIKSIDKGTLLNKITIDTAIGHITAIIDTEIVSQMNLKTSSPILVMIKQNDIVLSER